MRAVLKLTIDYDNETLSSHFNKDIKRALKLRLDADATLLLIDCLANGYAAQYLASNGLLSDEHSVVKEWGAVVEVDTQEGGG